METRFETHASLKTTYAEFLREYLELDHMRFSGSLDSSRCEFFLPHHGVIKDTSSTTKFRIVFNGSQKTNLGISLNDCLHIGPKLQTELMDQLLGMCGFPLKKTKLTAVFVCRSTRAVHLEVVSDYTTDAFLAYLDCGTNFVDADTALRNVFQAESTEAQRIGRALAEDRIQWRFDPPTAPHFRGLWEAAVKSLKHHLRRVTSKIFGGPDFNSLQDTTTVELCVLQTNIGGGSDLRRNSGLQGSSGL
ncbi:hypothetical protein ALC57_03104 [Trachymyrmex cornetzi]|uniref:Uncharacterized protein n=1 Tax=Trachymyrmex cornetzi TaxID=471704 RepID=A0A151JMT9_9HYME|nr:hypothetical protein ALC57_03104 [Trachymyrmex cornetzi]